MQQDHVVTDQRGAAASGAPATSEASAYRKVLKQVTAAILAHSGYEQTSTAAHETLTQLMESYLLALSEGTKLAYETATRTKPIYEDVVVSLANLGIEEAPLHNFLYTQLQNEPLVIQQPKIEASTRFQQSLQVGKTRSHPPYVADGLPPFPDPHTYIRTEISGDPEISYDKVRETAAEVARDSRRNLIDLMQRRFPTTCLFASYYERVKTAAQLTIKEQRETERRMAKMRQDAEKRSRMEKELKTVKDEMSGELTEDILETQSANSEEPEETPDNHVTSFFGAHNTGLKRYERRETVKNLVSKQLPPYCFVLTPTSEFRPYLSCLVTEDGAEEDGPPNGKKADHQ